MHTVFRINALSSIVAAAVGLLSLTSPTELSSLTSRPTLQPCKLADSTTLYLPADLEATVWAESPMLYRPTSIDIDIRGRVWVAEAAGNGPDGPTEGRISILSDANGDGRADNRATFVQDTRLVRPLGVSVIGRNVYVSNSPDLIVYNDDNADDQPERTETLLTGFGGKNQLNGVHKLVPGPAGNYYISAGDAVPYIVTDRDGWVLQAGDGHGKQPSSDGRIWTGGLAMRIRPNGSGLKVMADNFWNSRALAIDSYGNMWEADTDEKTHTSRIGWVMEGGRAGLFGTQPGRVSEAPGVMPAGEIIQNSSVTALVMYEDEKLGLPYRGVLLCADSRQHRIIAYKPDIRGAGYQLSGSDFVSGSGPNGESNSAFQPVAMAIGPDGAVYVASWQEAGANSTGRIYRIAPKGRPLKTPGLDLRTGAGQLAALLSPAPQIRMLGLNTIRQQGDNAIEMLMPLTSSLNAYQRSRAIFLLAQIGAEGQFEVERLLKSPEAQTRIVALRALRSITPENSKANPALTPSQQVLLPLLGNLALDQSVAVRRDVCVALRDVPYADCRRILLNLVQGYDGQDAYYLNALGEAASGKEEDLFADLRAGMPADPAEWDTRTASLIWELHPASALSLLRKRAEAEAVSPEARQQAVAAIAAINTPESAKVLADLSHAGDKTVAAAATGWINAGKVKPRSQSTTIETADRATTAPPTENQANRDLLASKVGNYTERRKAVLDLAQSTEGAQMLIELIGESRLSEAMMRVANPVLLKHPDQSIRTQAAPLFEPKPAKAESQVATADSVTVAVPKASTITAPAKPVAVPESTAVAVRPSSPVKSDSNKTVTPAIISGSSSMKPAVAEIAALTGSAASGQLVFKASCSRCHIYNQKGVDVGPELTDARRKFDKASLIESILYPNAAITPGYEPWLVATSGGQTFYGFITSDNAQSIIVKGVTGQKHSIPTNTIASRRQFTNSLMPSAQTMKLDQQQIADLTAYLLKL